jgi:hypothetical protein
MENNKREINNMKEKETPWAKLHILQCDIDYYLQDVNSKEIVPAKHGLDMIFKHISRELQDVKDVLLKEQAEREINKGN